MGSVNEIIERVSNSERTNSGDTKGGHSTPRDRPPLQWNDVHEVAKGTVRVIVSAANNGRFDLFSYRLARVDRPALNIGVRTTPPNPDRPATVENPGQADDIAAAVREAFDFINQKLAEAHAARPPRPNRSPRETFGGDRKTGKTQRDRDKQKSSKTD